MTEPVDRYDIEDARLLSQFISRELGYGINLAVDATIDDAILVDGTPGGTSVDYATLRAAVTTLQMGDLEPSAIVLSPTDWASVEAEAEAAFAGNPNVSPNDAFNRRLFGIPVMVTPQSTPARRSSATSLATASPCTGTAEGSGSMPRTRRLATSTATPCPISGSTSLCSAAKRGRRSRWQGRAASS